VVAAPTAGDIIGSISLPAPEGLSVDLVRQGCQTECALAIASRGDAASLLGLNWPLPVGSPRSTRGLSTPDDVFALAESGTGRFWSIGEEEAEVTVGITPLAAEARILLDGEAGFEHVKRFHALLALRNGRWVTLWSRDDAPGPHHTAVAVSTTASVERLVYLDAFFDPDDGSADRLDARDLVFDGSGTSVTERSASADGSPVYVLPLQEFSTAASAKQARANACLASTLALAVLRFTPSAKRGVALVKVGVDTAVLMAASRRASECLRAPVGQIQQLLPTREE